MTSGAKTNAAAGGVILGLNAFHGDAAACLLVEGEVVAAVEEERFSRVKHEAGFPHAAVDYCLSLLPRGPAQVTAVALNSDPSARRWAKILYVLQRRPNLALMWQRVRNRGARAQLQDYLRHHGVPADARVERVEHHRAHLASAFYAAPFVRACAVSLDGFGDFASAAWGAGHGAHLEVDDAILFPHSLGIFYQATTQYLGFFNYGDEYKLMGLAAYGHADASPSLDNLVRLQPHGQIQLELQHFRHHREAVPLTWEDGAPTVGQLYAESMVDVFGPARRPDDAVEPRHQDMAAAVQQCYERAVFHILRHAHAETGEANLVLAGGCAMNSLANGKVLRESGFEQLYVQPAPGDAGGAIGAAYVAAVRTGQSLAATTGITHAYLGPRYTNEEVAAAIRARQSMLQDAGCEVREMAFPEVARDTAIAIANGAVVGWFRGAMEWGPRALGNRSILADPRVEDMRARLNEKIKLRETFRPFAPSILSEEVDDWFESAQDVPFMSMVLVVREPQRLRVPAIVHADGTGRLQTVSHATNPDYYCLIEEFFKLTDVPILLNTSFNENEPIVCTPEEALDCFLRTQMDRLVLENFVVVRKHALHS